MINEKEQLKGKISSIELPKEEVTDEEKELLTYLKNEVISLVDEVYIPSKPVIPKFVIDFIKSKNINGSKLTSDIIYDFIHIKKRKEWLDESGKNFYKFALACEIGYEPQRYTVDFTEGEKLVEFVNDKGETEMVVKHISGEPEDNEKHEFTEEEIKKYDERYWAFANEVQNDEE